MRASGEVEERSATWLELFYDLVFVVTVAELVALLADDISLPGVLAYVALFIPIWWGWIGSTFYATRFDTDDLVHRLMTAVELFAVVALAVNVHGALGETSRGFALAYAVLRGVLVFKYFGAGQAIPEARPLTTRYARGFGLDAGLWFASVFVPPPFRIRAVGARSSSFVRDAHHRRRPPRRDSATRLTPPGTLRPVHHHRPRRVSRWARQRRERPGLFTSVVCDRGARAGGGVQPLVDLF